MELVMIFDMRAPDFGAAREQLFSTAIDMAEWADSVGFDVIGLGEHHSADDGYNPSPLILASAMASRTQRIRLRTAVLLAPCYDPIRLAEDVAILQILSKGRFELGLGFAYRSVEFAMYGKELKDRFAIGTTVGKLLKRALRGESLEFEGRPLRWDSRPPQHRDEYAEPPESVRTDSAPGLDFRTKMCTTTDKFSTISARDKAQSTAESPPPAITTFLFRKSSRRLTR